MISVRHLSKSFLSPDGHRVEVLRDVNFDIQSGEVVAIIGPSGTGKSTLLRMLNRLETPTSGEVLVNGKNILAKDYPVHQLRQKMGMVFQSFNLFNHLSVLDNVVLAPMKLLGLTREQAEQEAIEMLRKVGLAEKAHAMPTSLSGGQQQRTAIARTLAMHPDIVLFDEPTSALDPTMVGEVQGVMRTLTQEKMTMIVVTHKMRFARDISSRVLFLYDGVVLEDGTPEDIFSNPQRKETRDFVHRIRKLTFEIAGSDFDFYDMSSQIKQFCISCSMPEKMDPVTHVVEEMLVIMQQFSKSIHIEVNHSDLDRTSTVVALHRGETLSPLDRDDTDELAAMIVRGMSKSIQTELTPEGVQLTIEM